MDLKEVQRIKQKLGLAKQHNQVTNQNSRNTLPFYTSSGQNDSSILNIPVISTEMLKKNVENRPRDPFSSISYSAKPYTFKGNKEKRSLVKS